jgi:hypothetical protein
VRDDHVLRELGKQVAKGAQAALAATKSAAGTCIKTACPFVPAKYVPGAADGWKDNGAAAEELQFDDDQLQSGADSPVQVGKKAQTQGQGGKEKATVRQRQMQANKDIKRMVV